MKDCFHCKGSTAPKLKTHPMTLDECVIIVKNVPSLVCEQCGEVYFSDNVMKNLETIADRLGNIVKEVAIVDYAEAA